MEATRLRLNQRTSDDFLATATRETSSVSQGTPTALRQRGADDDPGSPSSLHNSDKHPSVSILDSVCLPYADDSAASSPAITPSLDVTLTPSVMTLELPLEGVSPRLPKKRQPSLASTGSERKLFRRDLPLAPGFYANDRKREPTYFRWTGFRQRPVSQLMPRDPLSVGYDYIVVVHMYLC